MPDLSRPRRHHVGAVLDGPALVPARAGAGGRDPAPGVRRADRGRWPRAGQRLVRAARLPRLSRARSDDDALIPMAARPTAPARGSVRSAAQITTLRAELQARASSGSSITRPSSPRSRSATSRRGTVATSSPSGTTPARAVRGIIHDRSQSGATVFVEPRGDDPARNNELTRLCLAERDEEQRVLGELTDRCAAARPAVGARRGLGALDRLRPRRASPERLDASEPARGAWAATSISAAPGILPGRPAVGSPVRRAATSSPSTSAVPAATGLASS